ncbi:hypothetical protein FOZ63_026150 [Perkinsus olseni]|uniref:BolA-like protein 1 n=1 Tax=Perkinsus olseni TaxID=32597 RepID=A0A7J6RYF8_PEROL|nr:hypothetical protein FOZ63_026150 [Perkinsus olseni]
MSLPSADSVSRRTVVVALTTLAALTAAGLYCARLNRAHAPAAMKQKSSSKGRKRERPYASTTTSPSSSSMSRPTYTAILRKVTDRLKPTLINIIDDSAKHASHAPMRGSDRLETHFRVEVVSDGFKGLNRVQRQKLMYSILSEEMDSNPGGTVHALSMSCKTPDEVNTNH